MSFLTGCLRPRTHGIKGALPVFNLAFGASSSPCNVAFKKRLSVGSTIKASLNSTSTVEHSQHRPEQQSNARFVNLVPQQNQKPRRTPPGRISQLPRPHGVRWLSTRHQDDFTDSTPIGTLLPAFDHFKLRDACRCSMCVDPSTKQKNFRTSDIPTNINIGSVDFPEPTIARITWQNDISSFPASHASEYSTQELLSLADSKLRRTHPVLWNRSQYLSSQSTWIDFNDFIRSDETLKHALSNLAQYGLIFVTNIPSNNSRQQEPSQEEISAVSKIATRIGPLYNSHYGLTWDVKSIPKAANVAYTNVDLGFHMDLLYKHSPPFIQLLHCLRNSRSGGESLFVDTFQAAQNLWNRPSIGREHFSTLASTPMTFHYVNDGQEFSRTRPTFHLHDGGRWDADPPAETKRKGHSQPSTTPVESTSDTTMPQLENIFYSPPFQGPLPSPSKLDSGYWDPKKLIEALKAFDEELYRDDMVVEVKLEPGTCVIFENLRVAHARRAFAPAAEGEGFRWLRGAYVGQDDYISKLRTLGII